MSEKEYQQEQDGHTGIYKYCRGELHEDIATMYDVELKGKCLQLALDCGVLTTSRSSSFRSFKKQYENFNLFWRLFSQAIDNRLTKLDYVRYMLNGKCNDCPNNKEKQVD